MSARSRHALSGGAKIVSTVRRWCRQAKVDAGSRPGVRTEESAELKRDNAELKRANVAEYRRRNEPCSASSVRSRLPSTWTRLMLDKLAYTMFVAHSTRPNEATGRRSFSEHDYGTRS